MLCASLLHPSLLCDVLICAREAAQVVQYREFAAAAAILGPLGKENGESHVTAQGAAAVFEPGSIRQSNGSSSGLCQGAG